MYSLKDQMRKSSRSEGAQIAEAWAKRLYVKHFVNKLTDADGEQLETQHWVETAMDWSYISAEEANDLLSEYFRLGRMVNATIKKAPLFCENTANNQ